jgi:hypothetical protein
LSAPTAVSRKAQKASARATLLIIEVVNFKPARLTVPAAELWLSGTLKAQRIRKSPQHVTKCRPRRAAARDQHQIIQTSYAKYCLDHSSGQMNIQKNPSLFAFLVSKVEAVFSCQNHVFLSSHVRAQCPRNFFPSPPVLLMRPVVCQAYFSHFWGCGRLPFAMLVSFSFNVSKVVTCARPTLLSRRAETVRAPQNDRIRSFFNVVYFFCSCD